MGAAVCENYGGYTLKEVMEDTPALQLAFLHQRIRGIWYRRVWPYAQLQAFIGNAVGGKSKGKSKTPAWKVFHGQELLPGYAMTDEVRESMPPQLPPQTCWAFIQAQEAGHLRDASWVLQLTLEGDRMERIEALAEAWEEFQQADVEQPADEDE